MKITDLPFNKFIGIEVSEREGFALSLPDDKKYTNHLGTVHASALLALAEASSGDYLIAQLNDIGFEVVPVVRRMEAKFKKPAHGCIFSKVKVPDEKRGDFLEALRKKERALIEIEVDVFDASDSHAVTATVEWFVAKR